MGMKNYGLHIGFAIATIPSITLAISERTFSHQLLPNTIPRYSVVAASSICGKASGKTS